MRLNLKFYFKKKFYNAKKLPLIQFKSCKGIDLCFAWVTIPVAFLVFVSTSKLLNNNLNLLVKERMIRCWIDFIFLQPDVLFVVLAKPASVNWIFSLTLNVQVLLFYVTKLSISICQYQTGNVNYDPLANVVCGSYLINMWHPWALQF